MYHHVNSDKYSNDIKLFEEHLIYISQNFTTVFPSDNLISSNNICLVFDDGYYDFYKYIFPLLKKYNLKAILGVIPSVVLNSCNNTDTSRLNIPHDSLFDKYKEGTFCTYDELKEMINSSLVYISSHSYSHKNLLTKDIDLELELQKSKQILEYKLNIKVNSFIFPFGKYDTTILNETKKHYKYIFRIGNGINQNFTGINGVIYRINGDNLLNYNNIFSTFNIFKYKVKSILKKILGAL